MKDRRDTIGSGRHGHSMPYRKGMAGGRSLCSVTKVVLSLLSLIALAASFDSADGAGARSEHRVYFEGTSYELHVYKIFGRQPGRTMLIIGGIQGDEPGGFLSADLYTDLTLEKGNLIVVPRANFKSIILFQRGVDGDMNRVFNKKEIENDMDRVVEIIKRLMGEADVFLNLHDGWGFHRPVYIDQLRNPKRFGQSIIVDADEFLCNDGTRISLGEMARQVLDRVNRRIGDKRYFMHYFNTKTSDPDTPFSDMKKTATFYALRKYCIPSFGIETSKHLPSLEMKILHHNYAINEFMALFGIVPEQPRILLLRPYLKYAVISVNSEPVVIENGGRLFIEKGDALKVIHVESNYERGISCDILGVGELNDFRKEIKIQNDTKIVFRKDNMKMGSVDVRIRKNGKTKFWVFIVKVNGKMRAVLANEVLSLKEGAELELIETFGDRGGEMDHIINFKGFIPPGVTRNTGDDRGVKILIHRKNFIKRYSRDGRGEVYPVIAGETTDEKARFWVRIVPG